MKLLPPDPKHYKLAPNWKYVSSGATDLHKTFRRVRERIAAEAKASQPKVRELKKKA